MASDISIVIKAMRLQGLLATVSPLVVGTVAAVTVTGELLPAALALAALVGFSLHVSMNVYNDVYDTRQGSDSIESSRSMFSGGSGALLENPEMEGTMLSIARGGLAVAAVGTLGLMWISDVSLWPLFIGIYALSAFLSKYYSAGPIKLAYRGAGEFFVWLAFGPMAVLLAAAAQGLPFHEHVVAVMPLCGIVTLMVALNGQMVDLPFDARAGKVGIVLRIGLRRSLRLMALLHLAATANLLLAAAIFSGGWILLFSLLVYLPLLPLAFRSMREGLHDADALYRGATLNFAALVAFSVALMAVFLALLFV